MSNEWTIISNGPSIEHLSPAGLPADAPIVAVNHAILHETIEADYWCCHEYGRGIENDLVRVAMGPTEETWVGRGHESRWHSQAKERDLLGLKPLKIVSHPQDTQNWRIAFRNKKWKTRVSWGGRTFFTAIANCIFRGAEVIRVWGAEMDGDIHFGGGPASEVIRQRTRRGLRIGDRGRTRWDFERAQVEMIIEECEQHGIEVVREIP